MISLQVSQLSEACCVSISVCAKENINIYSRERIR
jgi:hypothetical protein